MSKATALALLLGLLAGGAIGWLVGSDPAAPASYGEPRAGAPGSDERAPGSLRLEGRAGTTGEGGVLPPALDRFAQDAGASAQRGGRGFEALGLLYALGGHEAQLLALIDRGLAAGVDADRVLDLLAEMPAARGAALLAEVMARHPEADFDPRDVARLFMDAGDDARALAVVQEALPRREGLSRSLTRLLLQLDPAGAPALLLELAGDQGWGEDSLRTLRGLLAEADRDAALLPFLTRALEIDPRDHEALRMLAALDGEQARAHAQARLAEDPSDARLWALLGDLALRAGNADQAFMAYEAAAHRDPSPAALERLLDADPDRALPVIRSLTEGAEDDDLVGVLADAYLETGRVEEAWALYVQAHAADPTDGDWIEGLIAVDPDRAAAMLREEIERAPGSADDELLGSHGAALAAAGRPDEAFALYLAAHERDPGDHDWQLALAALDPARAVDVLDRHVRAHADDASGRGALGVALAATGRRAEAIAHLEHAIAEGDAALWYEELATLDPDRAVTGLRTRAEREGDRDDLWGALGRALEEQGDLAGARAAYREALVVEPDEAEWAEALRALR